MYRILNIGGFGLIEVWGQEQPDNINKNASNFKRKSNLVKWTSIKSGEIYNIFKRRPRRRNYEIET
jgi:hypothetical protein